MNIASQEVDSIFIFITGISAFLLLLVTGMMIYFVFRYRARKHPKSENITGNTTLEIVWTVVPLILVLAMFFYGWHGFKVMRNTPDNAMTIKVTGKMWKWSFEYENKKTSDSLLYVPQGKPIKLELNSTDVNHSFFIPEYRIKEDAVPGRTNYLWFYPEKTGVYDIFCAEYCGMSHSYMLAKLIVISEKEFSTWLNKSDSVRISFPKDSAIIPDTHVDTLKPKKVN
jgi:cytochrome c oxidase subunit 2